MQPSEIKQRSNPFRTPWRCADVVTVLTVRMGSVLSSVAAVWARESKPNLVPLRSFWEIALQTSRIMYFSSVCVSLAKEQRSSRRVFLMKVTEGDFTRAFPIWERKTLECIKVSPDKTIEVILKGGIHGKEKVWILFKHLKILLTFFFNCAIIYVLKKNPSWTCGSSKVRNCWGESEAIQIFLCTFSSVGRATDS